GADPQSPQALEVKAQIQERAATGPRVVCPNCGSTHGFRPAQTEGSPNPIVLLFGALPYLLLWIIGAGVNVGQLQCFRCQYVFRPRSRMREFGCVVLLVITLAAAVALIIWRS